MYNWNGRRRGVWIIFAFPFFLVFLAVAGLAVMLLWNWLLPAVFGLKTITFLQAVGILILAKILFGTHGRRPRPFYGRPWAWERWKKWHEEHPHFSEHDTSLSEDEGKDA